MRVLLVEDDTMLGKATAEGLRTAYAVDWCESAEDAAAALKTTPYDLVVLDINLPGKSGLELLNDLRANNDEHAVLFLTARDAVSHRIEGLNAGADDYLIKPFDLDELIARAGALIRRSQGRASSEISCGDIVYNPAAKQVKKNGKTVQLSGRELAVLESLMNNPGKVLSKTQIEEHIYDWGSGDIESNTIEVHISALRRKLGKDFIKTIRGVGYIIAS
ncbi:MAG: response regulator transcription factor [Rhodospirillales bacterium]|nr:response regulator transcription factor [Alphaproteobacteria bacterium]MCB9981477.1 response regulator transcription factor [Rhodospirillales bacterium]